MNVSTKVHRGMHILHVVKIQKSFRLLQDSLSIPGFSDFLIILDLSIVPGMPSTSVPAGTWYQYQARPG